MLGVVLPGLEGRPHEPVLEPACCPAQLVLVLMRQLDIQFESCKALQEYGLLVCYTVPDLTHRYCAVPYAA